MGVLAIFVYAFTWLGSGYVSWSMVNPSSFIGVLIFLFVWGILGGIVQMLLALVIAGLTSSK